LRLSRAIGDAYHFAELAAKSDWLHLTPISLYESAFVSCGILASTR
jgi:hypothetical protein